MVDTNKNIIFFNEFLITLFCIGAFSFSVLTRFYYFPFLSEEGAIYFENKELDEQKQIENLAYQIKNKQVFKEWKSKLKIKDFYQSILLLASSIGLIGLAFMFFIRIQIIFYYIPILLLLLIIGILLLFFSVGRIMPKIKINSIEMKIRKNMPSYQLINWKSISKFEIIRRTQKFRNEQIKLKILKIFTKGGPILEISENDLIGFDGLIYFLKTLSDESFIPSMK
ncbi:MAG: hypothetical protein ACTSVE_02235 [Candidatus Helarchaeota archaeon]